MGKSNSAPRRLSKTQVILILAAAAAILIGVYCFLLQLEQNGRNPEPTGDPNARYASDVTVEYDGRTYRQKRAVTTILLMGIDTHGDERTNVGERGGGQADFLRLLVLDREEKKICQLAIDRDTMAEFTILGVLGDVAGTRVDNISLSHYFGDGKEKSCELTRSAVSKLLLGARIDFYVAMNLDGVPVFNDALGGVTVTLEDDLSSVDPSWTPGTTVTLQGSQAEAFVRARRTVGDGTNESRMRRQQQYVSQAVRLMQDRVQEDENFIGHMFDVLSPYLVAGISRSQLVNEAYNARNYAHVPVISLAGEHRIGEEGFMQFWPDEDKLRETVLDLLFYQVTN
ncbi:MAG: LCP family protein [Clostridiales bacterium]|nr:LCP family protein [Clostridiales bacterium]